MQSVQTRSSRESTMQLWRERATPWQSDNIFERTQSSSTFATNTRWIVALSHA
jgi:hypothetical protein